MISDELQSLQLQKCDICNRSFQSSSLEKHQNVCQKLQTKRRPVFDSSKQRAVPLPEDYIGPKNPSSSQINRSTWALNGTSSKRWIKPTNKLNDTKKGEVVRLKKVPSKAQSVDELLLRRLHNNKKAMIECPHCLRSFQEGSADRHIAFCQEIHNRMPIYKDDWDAKWKLAMRTQYQPPKPRVRRSSNISKSSSIPSRKTKRSAPVIEGGLMNDLLYSHPHQRQHLVPLYNTRIDSGHEEYKHSPRKPRSKMVTYGAVQPFSGPVLSKEEKQNRFYNKHDDKKPQRVYVTDNSGLQSYPQNHGQVIMYPDTISAQIQTDQYEVPQLEPVRLDKPTQSHMSSTALSRYAPPMGYWPSQWPAQQPWYSEDYYLQMAPRMMAPVYYQPQWSPYPILPDVVPRTARPMSSHMKALEYHPEDIRTCYKPLSNERNLLSRDDTLLDENCMYFGGPFTKSSHKHCANCGSRFTSMDSRYCCDCGAVNDGRR